MGSVGDVEANNILDWRYGSGSPLNFYVGLFLTEVGNGFTGQECSGGGYARAQVPNTPINWQPATNRQKFNGSRIVFPTVTATWGVPAWFALFDQPSGLSVASLKGWGRLASPVPIVVGRPPSIPPGALRITVRAR